MRRHPLHSPNNGGGLTEGAYAELLAKRLGEEAKGTKGAPCHYWTHEQKLHICTQIVKHPLYSSESNPVCQSLAQAYGVLY